MDEVGKQGKAGGASAHPYMKPILEGGGSEWKARPWIYLVMVVASNEQRAATNEHLLPPLFSSFAVAVADSSLLFSFRYDKASLAHIRPTLPGYRQDFNGE